MQQLPTNNRCLTEPTRMRIGHARLRYQLPYYDVNTTFSIRAYASRMSKRVISVRLSDERLHQLDKACAMLKMNRSEVIDAALRLLPEIASGRAETTYAPKWLTGRARGGEDEQD